MGMEVEQAMGRIRVTRVLRAPDCGLMITRSACGAGSRATASRHRRVVYRIVRIDRVGRGPFSPS
jgi:hypothetical protein